MSYAELYALSRYFTANSSATALESQAISSSGSVQIDITKDGTPDESELRLAQLQHQLPSNEPGTLMHLVEDANGEDEDDEETKECKTLFKNKKFFLSREVRYVGHPLSFLFYHVAWTKIWDFIPFSFVFPFSSFYFL